MNKIEQMHLDTMIVKDLQSAVRSAEITEQISIEFVEWIWKNCDEEYMSQHSWENMFKEFLKTKQ